MCNSTRSVTLQVSLLQDTEGVLTYSSVIKEGVNANDKPGERGGLESHVVLLGDFSLS